MGSFVVRASRPLAVALSPLLIPLGRQVERDMPQLPEAAGPRSGRRAAPGPPVSVLVIGESTAAGVGVDHLDQAVAGGVIERLHGRGLDVTWQVLGRTGYTAEMTYRALLPLAVGRYDLVLVMLGVNDVLKMTPLTGWRATVRALLTELANRGTDRQRIVLTGVPRVDSFQILPPPLRAVLGLHAKGMDQHLVDLARRFERVRHLPTAPVREPRFLSRDGFHPSAAGYAEWARSVVEEGLADWDWPH